MTQMQPIPKKGKLLDAVPRVGLTFDSLREMAMDYDAKSAHFRADEQSLMALVQLPDTNPNFTKVVDREVMRRGHIGTLLGFPLIADAHVNGFTIHANA